MRKHPKTHRSLLKQGLFALAAVLLSTVAIVGVVLALDLYAHNRLGRSAGLNYQGYRGPVLGRKQPGETREREAGPGRSRSPERC